MSDTTANPARAGPRQLRFTSLEKSHRWRLRRAAGDSVLCLGSLEADRPFRLVSGAGRIPRISALLPCRARWRLGIGEMLGAVLILVPRFRRWGAWLLGLLLVVFMLYIGANYGALVGKDCSLFPAGKARSRARLSFWKTAPCC